VLFAYTKQGFPMLRQTKKIKGILERETFDDLKQLDLAGIASNMLQVPTPFSSLGIFHPLFHMSANMLELPQIMLSNLYQLDRYVDEYCQQNPMEWCEV